MKRYMNIEQIERIINILVEKGANVYELIEGCLGYGLTVVTGAENCKTMVIKEEYLNAWSSANSVRFYKKLPKKYAEMINN